MRAHASNLTARIALAALVALAILSAQGAAGLVYPPERAQGGRVARDLQKKMAAGGLRGGKLTRNETVNYFQQLIDHDGTQGGTFKQRWWMDLSAYSPSSKIAFMYINGEGRASGSPSGYAEEYGKEIGAALFSLEHRYYGESMPAALTDRKMLKYLTVENALADLKAFKDYLESEVLGRKMKWIAVGGSYSGALSVWLREKYPSDFAAAWSSSGVVNAVFDYHAFDGHLVSVLTPSCANAIKEVFNMFSKAFDNATQRAEMLDIFGTPNYFSKADMSWMLADGSAMAVQYGYKNSFCDSILPFDRDNAFKRYARAIKDLWGEGFTSDCYYSTECLSNPSYSSQWSSNYAWVYQCCTQLAYWQTSYPGSLRTSDITTEYFIGQCRQAFGDDTFSDTFAFNAKFGGATPKIDKVIALQASDDPWLPAGTMKSLGEDYPRVLAQCNGCGHCGDLHSSQAGDPQSLRDQRSEIKKKINEWTS